MCQVITSYSINSYLDDNEIIKWYRKITSTLEDLSGVIKCQVSLDTNTAKVEYEPDNVSATIICNSVNNIGTKVINVHNSNYFWNLFIKSSKQPCMTPKK